MNESNALPPQDAPAPALDDAAPEPPPGEPGAKRISRPEKYFLWCFGLALLLLLAVATISMLRWTAGQGGILEDILLRKWNW